MLGKALIDAYRTKDGIALLEPAVDEFGDLARSPEGVALAGQLARGYYLDDRNGPAIELADRVLAVAEHDDMRALVADTLVTKGTALAGIGRSVEGIGAIEAGRKLAAANGFGGIELRALNNICYAGGLRALDVGLESAREGLALARKLGVRGFIASMTQNIAEFSFRTGDWDEAVALLDQALSEDWDSGDEAWLRISHVPYLALRGEPVDAGLAALTEAMTRQTDIQAQSNYEACLAWVALARGELEEARDRNHRSEGLASTYAPIARPRAARASLWLGDAAAAAEDLAVTASAGIHGPAIDADKQTLEAGIAAFEGRTAEALGLYREALRRWHEIGLAWDEALCGLDMAILIGSSEPEARAAGEASRQILTRLGARPMIERLDAALAAEGPVRSGRPAASPTGQPARA
jgi:tetratricopeptide (TPR) repeat protein